MAPKSNGSKLASFAASPERDTPARSNQLREATPVGCQPSYILRLTDMRGDLGNAVSELERTLLSLGVVDSTSYSDARNQPQAAINSEETVFNLLSSLKGESQSVLGRFIDFVYGVDREEDDEATDEDGDDQKKSRTAAERTMYGRKFQQVAQSIEQNYSFISSYLSSLEDSLLSRPEQDEMGAAGNNVAHSTESVIEILENVQLRTDALVQRIHDLNGAIRAAF